MARVLLLPVLFTILCSVLFAETAVDIDKKKVVLKSLSQCKGVNMPMIWSGLSGHWDEKTGQFVISLDVRLKKEVSRDFLIVFNIWKCDASGNPDSCEIFLKDFNATDICTYIEMKDQVWSEFMEHFDKPVVCPIKPGLYKLRNMTISTDSLKFLPFSDAVWKVEMIGYDKEKLISCVITIVQVLSNYVRKHQ